jgi:potassium efflux system protein
MIRKTHLIAVTLLLSVLALPAGAQTEDAPERRIDLDEVRTFREQTEANAALGGELQAQVLALCDEAIGSLEASAVNTAAAAAADRERAGVGRMVEALQAELKRPDRPPRLDLPRKPTVGQADDALARERARLAANRAALRDVERLAEERANSRNEISQRLGALDQEIERLSDELRAVTQQEAHPEVKRAARMRVLARREAALSEITSLRASLALLEDRGALIPLEVDHAQRRVAFSEQMVALHEEAAQDLRRLEAEESLQRVREQSDQASEFAPELAEIAAETEGFAEMLWGSQGVVAGSEQTAKALLATRKHLSDLGRIAELTRRKFEAFGHRGSITRWWPTIPEDFPEPGDVASDIRRLETQIPAVEHQLITFEQQRSTARELAHQIWLDLQAVHGDELDRELERTARDLMAERRELLDLLIQHYGRFSNQLVEHQTVSIHFLNNLQEVERFLYSHLLWARSVPRPVIPRVGDMADGMLWLFSSEHRQSIARTESTAGLTVGGTDIVIVFLIGLMLLLRRRIGSRLAELAKRVEDPSSDSYRLTLEGLLQTILLAAPLPLALYFVSVVLQRAEDSTFLYSASFALSLVALAAAVLELTRQLFAPRGLAEAHFGWPSRITGQLYRGMRWPEAVSLPLLFVGLLFVEAGQSLDSPQQLQLYNNSLGRVAFIAAMAVLGLSILGMLRPEPKREPVGREGFFLWTRHVSHYAFPAALLAAFPAVFLATVVPALLAAFGYYVTGLLLAYQMLRTLLVAVGVLVLGGLLFRWRASGQSQPLRESGEQAQFAEPSTEQAAAEAQVRQLFRFVVIVAAAVGFYSVWSDALPMLQVMKRVQIWPRIAVMAPVEAGGLAPLTTSGEVSTDASEGAAESGPGSAPAVPGVTVPTTSGPDTGAAGSTPLTLWSLFEALLAVLITVAMARNIPGLLELTLRRRTNLDSGARVAFSTLVRYTITIVGVSVFFGVLGISWSKIQWLAAALTFGLGFGLQEIVANFVSGLILLMERPVRVGDVVTIGTLMGTVSRIQIRATTITLWDRSEMIVPNKEFITTKLVNWTLSDSKRRIEIPLRIAYGADLDKVKQTLIEVAGQHPAVLDDPVPQALLLGFGNDAINFELRFVVDFGQGLKTKDEVQMAIDKAFHAQGIEFALPLLSVRLPESAGGGGSPPEATEPTG